MSMGAKMEKKLSFDSLRPMLACLKIGFSVGHSRVVRGNPLIENCIN